MINTNQTNAEEKAKQDAATKKVNQMMENIRGLNQDIKDAEYDLKDPSKADIHDDLKEDI